MYFLKDFTCMSACLYVHHMHAGTPEKARLRAARCGSWKPTSGPSERAVHEYMLSTAEPSLNPPQFRDVLLACVCMCMGIPGAQGGQKRA